MADTAEAPPQSAEQTPPQRPEPRPERKPKKSIGRRIREHPIKLLIFLIILVAAGIAGYRFWTYLESYESTDDAQVDGDIYAVTSRIAGTIKAVYVEDNQQVKAGQLLVELDPRDFEVAVAQAQSSLKESQTQVSVARPNVPITSVSTETTLSSSEADIAANRAAVASAQRDHEAALADVRNAEADNVK